MMYKILIKFILIFLFLINIAYSEIIKKVEVKGNQRISEETILVLSDIKIGKEFSSDNLNTALKKLYETDFFSKINPILDKKKFYTVKVWSQDQRIAKKISNKLQVQLFEAGYKVSQRQKQLESIDSYEKTCNAGSKSTDNIHILLNESNRAKLAICNKGGWKWIS